ncbi:MAG: TetR/AcrR family transcriptional regulator [Chloroflexi bacterium]|nr:TetR/AcrR family transcriptional regulator [Chloroflexota bacterium]
MTNDSTRDPESTKMRILDAALDVFANKGYYDARMDEIVEDHTPPKGPSASLP